MKWTGVYEYGYNPNLDSMPDSVSFKLRLEFSNDTEFTGHVFDAPNSSMPEPGTVSGKLTGNKIEFVKQMPRATFMEANGESLTFDCAHPKIYYNGEYIPEENLMVGGWYIEPIASGVMEYPGGAGTWHADAEI